jgi:LAO/AO transport system kinase
MESADLVAINKTDGDNEQRNQRASMDLRQAIALLPPRESGLRPEVLLCSATTSKGISKLADELERIGQLNRDNGYLQVRRQEQARWWMRSAIEEALIEGFYSNERVSNQLRDYEERVRQGLINPFDAAQELLRLYGQAT